MKTLFFSLIVIVSGYYLFSQTDSGSALLDNWLPSQQIEQTTDELLENVDSRLQDFASRQSAEHKQKIQQLEQQISELNARLNQQQSETNTKQQLSAVPPYKPPQQQTAAKQKSEKNDALNLPPNIKQIQGQTATVATDTQKFANEGLSKDGFAQDSFDLNRPDTTDADTKTASEKTLIRQKQASLQDIAARMEQVSLQVASGNY